MNYHFGSKENLYAETWRRCFAESIKAYPPDGGVEKSAPPEERLRGQIRSVLSRVSDENNMEFLIVQKERANPTGLLQEVMRKEIEPLRQRMESVIREIIGPHVSSMQVAFCGVSVISQCIDPAAGARGDRGRRQGTKGAPFISDMDAYLDHVTNFSLAGMRAIREKAERGRRDTRKARPAEASMPETDTSMRPAAARTRAGMPSRRSASARTRAAIGVLALVLCTGLWCCQAKTLRCPWTDAAPAIDAAALADSSGQEWEGAVSVFEDEQIRVGLRNDDTYLYIGLLVDNRNTRAQILVGGLTLWFDPAGEEDRTFGVRYPLGIDDQDRPVFLRALLDGRDVSRLIDSLGVFGEQVEILGPMPDESSDEGPEFPPAPQAASATLARAGGAAIEVAARMGGASLLYELKVPLKADPERPYAIGCDAGRKIAVGIETRGGMLDDRPGPGGRAGGERMGPPPGGSGSPPEGGGGRGGPGGGRPGRGGPGGGGPGQRPGGSGGRPGGNQPEPVDLWFKVSLSSAQDGE